MYKTVTEISEIENYIKGANVIAFDFECSPTDKYRNDDFAALDPHKADITGISLSVWEGTAIYIPLNHRTWKHIDIQKVLSILSTQVFKNPNIVKVAHNLVYETMFLYKHGIICKKPVYDTICASQLTLKSETEYRSLKDSGLKTLAPELFGVELPSFAEVTGGRHFDELDPYVEATINYACADSDYTLRLYNAFNKSFEMVQPKHRFICEEVESPAAIYSGIMKYNGIGVDKALMFKKQFEAEEKLAEIKTTLLNIAGNDIDLGANASTVAFKKYLFDELKLPVLKRTEKYGKAVDDEAIILLKDWCTINKPEFTEFLTLIQEYRKWSKIKSTYIDGFLKHINKATGRIHPDLFQLGTDTGRFSGRNPNIQNLPRKDSDPVGIRNFFVPREGYTYLDFDFSQIELRVGAYFCRDEKMLETYANDGDIHAATTSVIYNIPFEQAIDKNAEHYKERRTIAKNCNFGVFFGLYPKGLQRTLKFKAGLDTSLESCETIIRNLKAGYPSLSKWQTQTKHRAGFRKYAETSLGRRRILKGINSSDWGIKSYWERCALNTPIQGTAADILKLAMGSIVAELAERPYIKPLITIHDELLFEVETKKLNDATMFIKSCMEAVPFDGFDVPIKAEGAIGLRFGELEELL